MHRLQPTFYNEVTSWGAPGLFWPDHSNQSELTRSMIRNKQINDDNFWTNHRKVLDWDTQNQQMMYFKTWASTQIIPLTSNLRYLAPILDILSAPEAQKYIKVLEETWIGMHQSMIPFYMVSADFNTSMNRCINLYHLISAHIAEKVQYMHRIVELGGGYGDLSLLTRRLGFEGDYTIFDFPEMNRIQEYYLLSHANENKFVTNTTYESDSDRLCMANMDKEPADLVIGTWSFTEMPFDLRNRIYAKYKNAKMWLIVAEKSIFGFDNYKYLEDTFSHQYDFNVFERFYGARGSRLYTFYKK